MQHSFTWRPLIMRLKSIGLCGNGQIKASVWCTIIMFLHCTANHNAYLYYTLRCNKGSVSSIVGELFLILCNLASFHTLYYCWKARKLLCASMLMHYAKIFYKHVGKILRSKSSPYQSTYRKETPILERYIEERIL